jgi:putative GTP pyrophosphokinase
VTPDDLRAQYAQHASRAERLRTALVEQIHRLARDHEISFGVQLESRVKTLDSVLEKLERRSLVLRALTDLNDLVGLRLILLFKRDLQTTRDLLLEKFDVVSVEDVAGRLEATQFGYQSLHAIVRLLPAWLAVPTLADLGDLKAEIQIRTLAQHIWAAASHELQYKQEEDVPPLIRRSIHRVSALLETVDLEFDRVLTEREHYLREASAAPAEEPLNADLLAVILDQSFPKENREGVENYAVLLGELAEFDVKTASDLRNLLLEHKKQALQEDRKQVTDRRRRATSTTRERIERGVFFNHVGLARAVMRAAFGERYDAYRAGKGRARHRAAKTPGSNRRITQR